MYQKFNRSSKAGFQGGAILILAFILWTFLIQVVDVQPVGVNDTNIGFATLNTWFHRLTGVHMAIYTVTDWLGLVPIAVCACFGVLGLAQWIHRKNMLKVDRDILFLGIYYILVILGYLLFEMIPINYRPILIAGVMEASYPSSTTLLVICVMPTLLFQMKRRSKSKTIIGLTKAFVVLFSAFMVMGRLIAGVHWITDIIGSLLLSGGLYLLYRSTVLHMDRHPIYRKG